MLLLSFFSSLVFKIFILQYLCVSDSKMTEHPTKEKEVLEIFEEVSVRRREAEIVSVFFLFLFQALTDVSLQCLKGITFIIKLDSE